MEVKTKEYKVWRDPETKEIIRREEVRDMLISETDIESMNRQMYSAYLNGDKGRAYPYFEKEAPKKEAPKKVNKSKPKE